MSDVNIRDYFIDNMKRVESSDYNPSEQKETDFLFITNKNSSKNPGLKDVNLDNKIRHINIQ